MYKHRTTLANHFINAWTILVVAIGSVCFRYFMVYQHGVEDIATFNLLALNIFLINFIPQSILHLRYYFLNKGVILYYWPTEQRLSIEIKHVKYNFSFEDIENIERSKSITLVEKRTGWFPWDSYNYSIIRLKNGQQFVVTSLLVPNLDLPLESEKIELRKRFYCYPFGAKENLNPHDD